jgi:hypothetical protein
MNPKGAHIMATQQPKFRKSVLSAIALLGASLPLSLLAGGLPAMAHDRDGHHDRSLIRFDIGNRHHSFEDYFLGNRHRDHDRYVVYFRRDDDDSWQYEGTYWDRDDAERVVRRLEHRNYFARYKRQ